MKNPRKHNLNGTRRRAPAQVQGPVFNTRSTVPWRFPAFPRQLQFSSRFSQSVESILAGTQYNRRVGLFSFNNQIPQYVLTMYNLYRYCRITGVHVALTISPDVLAESAAVEIAMAKVPFDEGASVTPAILHTVRGSKYALCSTSGGAPQTKIQGSWASFDELGNPVYDRTFWQTRTEAGSTTLDPDEPVIAVAARSILAQTAVVSLNLEVTYHMEFFDLEIEDTASLANNPTQLEPTGLKRRQALRVDAEAFTPLDDSDDYSRTTEHRDKAQKPNYKAVGKARFSERK